MTTKKKAPVAAAAPARKLAPKQAPAVKAATKKAPAVSPARAKAKAKGNAAPTQTVAERREEDLKLRAKLVMMSKAKAGVSKKDFIASTGITPGRADRLVNAEVAVGMIVRDGATKDAVYRCRK